MARCLQESKLEVITPLNEAILRQTTAACFLTFVAPRLCVDTQNYIHTDGMKAETKLSRDKESQQEGAGRTKR